MSSRLVRRHHEAASRAAGTSEPSGLSDEEDDELAPTSRQRSVFALLEEEEEDSEDLDDAASTDGEHVSSTIATESREAEALAASISSFTPHLSQKGKRHGKKARTSPDDDEDEDSLLAMPPLGRASESAASELAPEPPPPLDPWRLIALHVDVSNELARRFGRQTLRQAAAAERKERHQGGGEQHARGYAAAAARLRERGSGGRGRLIKPRDTWPPFGGGLDMEIDHDAAARDASDVGGVGVGVGVGGVGQGNAQYFVFTHSSAYRQSQRELDDAVESGDPNALQHVTARHPFQVDGLLRLSEYYALAGQLELSAEHVERALYACEQSLHPMCRLLDGSARLRHTVPANRPFFIALYRHMISVGRRGCPRTALELGRLLLSLDPENDPMRALLHIDFYALKADEAAANGVEDDCLLWLLQLPTAQLRCHSLPLFPNYAFSLALARKRLHNRLLEQSNERRLDEVMEQRAAAAATEEEAEAEARTHLRRALLLFPAALPLILDGGGQDGADGARVATLRSRWAAIHGAAGNAAQCGATLRKLLALYVKKSATLWAGRGARTWLVAEAERLCGVLEAATTPVGLDEEALEVKRLWADLQAVREHEYGTAAVSGQLDEFASADPDDFAPTPPDALPADQLEQLEPAGALGAAPRQWVRVARRQLRPEGRLVVPRDEWRELDAATHPFVQFFVSLLPWTVAPREWARRRR